MYYNNNVQFGSLSVTPYELFSPPKHKSGEILLYENSSIIGSTTIFLLEKEHEEYWYISEIDSPSALKIRILKDIINTLMSRCFIPIVILITLTDTSNSNKLMTQFTRVGKLYEQLGFSKQPDFSYQYLTYNKKGGNS